MAIRATNSGRQSKQYKNHDGPGNTTIDFGPAREGRPTMRDRWESAGRRNGYSPYYGRDGDTSPMPWVDEGTPFFTPNAGDPRNAGYFVAENTSMDPAIAEAHARNRDAYAADPAFAQAKAAGDIKGMINAMIAMKEAGKQQRFIDQGGTAETYKNRFSPDANWPVPRSPSGNYQYGPGRPGPTPPGVAGGAGGGASTGRSEAMGMPAKGGGPAGPMPRGGASTGAAEANMRPDAPDFSRAIAGLASLTQGATPPGMMNADMRSKLAMGMPAKFFDPNYKPGRAA